MGWFFGFKLHLVVNDQGELLGCYLTAGNIDDRQPVLHLARNLFGKLIGDKGYISQELIARPPLQRVCRIKRRNFRSEDGASSQRDRELGGVIAFSA